MYGLISRMLLTDCSSSLKERQQRKKVSGCSFCVRRQLLFFLPSCSQSECVLCGHAREKTDELVFCC